MSARTRLRKKAALQVTAPDKDISQPQGLAGQAPWVPQAASAAGREPGRKPGTRPETSQAAGKAPFNNWACIGCHAITPEIARHWLSVTRGHDRTRALEAANYAVKVFAHRGATKADVAVIGKDGHVIAGLRKVKEFAQADAELVYLLSAYGPRGSTIYLDVIGMRKPQPTASEQQGAKGRAGKVTRA